MPLLIVRVGFVLLLALIPLAWSFMPTEARAQDRQATVGILSYPPFSYEDERGQLVGAAVELVRAALEASGYKAEFELLPYVRCIQLAEAGEIDACATVNRSTSKKLLVSKGTVASTSQTFFVRRDDPWTYRGIESLAGRRVLTVAGYNYRSISSRYQDFLEQDESITVMPASEQYLVRIAQMIASDRADVFNEGTDPMNFALRKASLETALRPAGRLSTPNEMFMGFTLGQRGETLRRIFDEGWETIEASGGLREIQEKYRLAMPDEGNR